MTAVLVSKWPSAAAGLPNGFLVAADSSLMYHRPGVDCARLAEARRDGGVRRVTLAQALVFCRPCTCWRVAR